MKRVYLIHSTWFRTLLLNLLFCFIAHFVVISYGNAADDLSHNHVSKTDDMVNHGTLDDDNTKNQRIVGGEKAPSGAWPWMAAIIEGENNYRDLNCGAVLIDTRWVLTAAHCVTDPPYEVLIGTSDLYEGGTRIGVKNVYIHSEYFNSEGTLMPDVALIELVSDAPYEHLSIYTGSDDLVGEMATVIGWGALDPYGRRYPSHLMQADVPIVSHEVCNLAYDGIITEYEMCAGYDAGGIDSCTGDSGGPMMVYIDDQWQLVGITAWGEGCAEPGYYGVYTKITAVSDWILWQKEKPFQKSVSPESETYGCGSFDGDQGKLHVPCVDVFDTKYWFDFILDTDHFDIVDFGKL